MCSSDLSAASHSHYFASLTEAWRNLPEDMAERFPTVEALRKWALIKAGFRDERSVVCSNKTEAQRIATFIRHLDDMTVVVVTEATLTVMTAKSQSMRAMGRVEFQRSKEAVLDVVAQMIGVKRDALAANAGKAA